MKQLELFERPVVDLLAKIVKESAERRVTNYHWNGEPL